MCLDNQDTRSYWSIATTRLPRSLGAAPPPMAQGDLAHKKLHPPPSPLYAPKHSHTVGSYEEAVSYERGTPVALQGLLDI